MGGRGGAGVGAAAWASTACAQPRPPVPAPLHSPCHTFGRALFDCGQPHPANASQAGVELAALAERIAGPQERMTRRPASLADLG
jgi:hypothetical protein